jgi:predicted CXXCH cytochrome family protein
MLAKRVVMLRRLSLVALLAAIGACTDETIVYRNRPPFNTPPDMASGFLGYFDASTKQTSCGNCHVDHQRRWALTAHADAWADLDASPAQQASCNSCHSVTERGNAVEGSAGYDRVAHAAYEDVQCESCHGPGLAHASEPDLGPVPLARFRVTDTTDQASCAECHTGKHNPFVEEWSQSRHAEIRPSEAGNASCQACHEARGALRAWGQSANFVERDSTGASSYFPAATCALCHNPHGSPNTAQLRFPIDVASEEQNLCVKCHMRRIEPTPASSRGAQPHAPQGAIFYGIGGYRNPTYFVYDSQQVATTHASPTANQRQCAGCHVVAFSKLDTVTNTTIFSTGHTFRPIPCLVNGQPVADNSCAYTTAARSWKACATSGCHVSEAVAQTVFTSARNDLRLLADQIWVDLDNDETIDAYPADTGYLAKVKLNQPAAFTYTDNTITAAEGAEFNARTVGEGLYGNGDKSLGVHNAFLSRALLQANIQELLAVYSAFLPAPPAAVQRLMAEPLPGATRTNALRPPGPVAHR